MFDSLQPHGLYSPWNSLGQNTGVGSLSLLQGIFPTQGANLLQVDSLPAVSPGSPRILAWVAYPFSSRSSQPRNRNEVACIAGRFFTNWAVGEALQQPKYMPKVMWVAKLLPRSGSHFFFSLKKCFIWEDIQVIACWALEYTCSYEVLCFQMAYPVHILTSIFHKVTGQLW